MQPLQRILLAYKERYNLTYEQLGADWAVSANSLRKMGRGERRVIGVKAALRIEKRTNGEVSAADLILAPRKRRV